MTTAGDELRAILGAEVERMNSDEAIALFKGIVQTISFALPDQQEGDHAVALGAVVMTLTFMLKEMSATPGAAMRLKAAVKAMIDVNLATKS